MFILLACPGVRLFPGPLRSEFPSWFLPDVPEGDDPTPDPDFEVDGGEYVTGMGLGGERRSVLALRCREMPLEALAWVIPE